MGIEFKDPAEALKKAEGVFTGGGNTFLLVKQLYEYKVLEVLRDRLYFERMEDSLSKASRLRFVPPPANGRAYSEDSFRISIAGVK